MINVEKAFFARWNAAGLDSSIAKIYPSGDKPKSKNNSFGTPTGNDLPRAEYESSNPPPRKSRNSRVFTVPVVVRIFGTGHLIVAEYVQAVKDAYVNAETTMTMIGGSILEIDEGNAFTQKVDDNLFAGMVMLLFRVRIGNAEVTV